MFKFFAKIAKHKNAYILKTVLDRADCADFGCHNSIRLEAEHFLNTLALTFISFSGCFVFAVQKHYLFFASDPLVNLWLLASYRSDFQNWGAVSGTQTVFFSKYSFDLFIKSNKNTLSILQISAVIPPPHGWVEHSVPHGKLL